MTLQALAAIVFLLFSNAFARQVQSSPGSYSDFVNLAREFEPNAQSIVHWVGQAERDGRERRDGGAASAEREELSKLRRENYRLRQERDILAKAAAWFAKDKTPSGSSNS